MIRDLARALVEALDGHRLLIDDSILTYEEAYQADRRFQNALAALRAGLEREEKERRETLLTVAAQWLAVDDHSNVQSPSFAEVQGWVGNAKHRFRTDAIFRTRVYSLVHALTAAEADEGGRG